MRTLMSTSAAVLMAALVLVPVSAQASGKVTVRNDQGTAKVDPKYATTVQVSGSGFQSIKNGHGGIYVFFGSVSGTWQPSKGGQTGRNMLYAPDSESKVNQGFQKFVTFPGNTQTGSSANGGQIKANGTWSTDIVIPGATFKAVDRSGKAQTVDCLKTTCGVITIGAHGVKNQNNESFTPVSFADLYDSKAPATAKPPAAVSTPVPLSAATESAPAVDAPPVVKAATATLSVDQASAVAGRVMTFNAVGLNPGDQIVASFDDGMAAVGPLNVGPNGQVAGALQIPATTRAGTHTLKVTGSVAIDPLNFPVSAEPTPDSAAAPSDDSSTTWMPIAFAAVALLALLGALVFSALRIRSLRKKAAQHAAN